MEWRNVLRESPGPVAGLQMGCVEKRTPMALGLLALRATVHGEVGYERRGWRDPGRARERWAKKSCYEPISVEILLDRLAETTRGQLGVRDSEFRREELGKQIWSGWSWCDAMGKQV